MVLGYRKLPKDGRYGVFVKVSATLCGRLGLSWLGSCKNQMLMRVLPRGLFTLPLALFSLQFYGCISQQQNMMQDFVRTATYHRAILQNHVDFRDKVMLTAGHSSFISGYTSNHVQESCQKLESKLSFDRIIIWPQNSIPNSIPPKLKADI